MTDEPIKAKGPAELLVILAVFVIINAASQVFQPLVSLNEGRGWDGVEYYSMAEQLAEGKLPAASAPFVYRIGTPFIVSLFFRDDLLLGFKVVNIIGNLVTVILLTLWLRLYLHDWRIRSVLVLLFMVQWFGPVRYVYYHPAYTEPWLLAFLLLGLLGIHRLATRPSFVYTTAFGLICLLGAAFREAFLIIPIALLFATNPFEREYLAQTASEAATADRTAKVPPAFCIPLVLAVLSWVAVLGLVTSTSNYSFLKRAVLWGYNQSFAIYIHSWFVAYGPILVLLLYNWRKTASFLAANQFMLVYLIGISVLAWIGGTDTIKFLFWAMPVVYLLIGIALEDRKNLLTLPLIVVLAVSQLLSERILWPVPDYPSQYSSYLTLLTVVGSKIQYLDLSPSHGSRDIQVISFLQYLALSFLILCWLWRREKIVGTASASPDSEHPIGQR